MHKSAIAHTVKLLTEPDKIIADIKKPRFTQQHVLSDDYESDLADRPYTRIGKKHRKAHGEVKPVGSSNVVGVRLDGDKWVATININRQRMMLYRGDSLEDAIQARKEAELKRTEFIAPKNPHIPRGVYEVRHKHAIRYVANCQKDGKSHNLYYGPSLAMAIASRQEWERENGFDKYHALNCFRLRHKPNKGSTSGVAGVSLDRGKYWRATGTADNVKKSLYCGKSLKAAIKARKEWEKSLNIRFSE